MTSKADSWEGLYLGMPRYEVRRLLGSPDGEGSGLDVWMYDNVGCVYFGGGDSYDDSLVTSIWSADRTWDMHTLISEAVKGHQTRELYTGEYPTECHILFEIDATPDCFTAYVLSLYETFQPQGEYDVRSVHGVHTHLVLRFTKTAKHDYEPTEYWEPGASEYVFFTKERFPENTSAPPTLAGVRHASGQYES